MRATGIAIGLALCTLAAACDRAAPAGTPAREGVAEGAAPAKAASGEDQGALRLREHGEEGEEESGEAPDVRLTERVALGAEAAEGLEEASAADIVADPERFRGKSVRVSGTVKGYCHHARAWFAIDAPGATPPYLRVLAQPAFAAPHGCMGARATAHGTVEVVELPASRVEHFESEHRLGAGPPATGEQATRAVLRAAGAVFEPAP